MRQLELGLPFPTGMEFPFIPDAVSQEKALTPFRDYIIVKHRQCQRFGVKPYPTKIPFVSSFAMALPHVELPESSCSPHPHSFSLSAQIWVRFGGNFGIRRFSKSSLRRPHEWWCSESILGAQQVERSYCALSHPIMSRC